EAIAEAAGVSPRTFFNYFQSKEDAMVGVSPNETSELLDDLAARPEDEAPLDSLRAMALAAAARLEAKADEMMARHRLTQAHPSLAMRRAARFTEVEGALAGAGRGHRRPHRPGRGPRPVPHAGGEHRAQRHPGGDVGLAGTRPPRSAGRPAGRDLRPAGSRPSQPRAQ